MSNLFNFTFHSMGSPCQLQFYTETENHAHDICRQVTALLSRLEKKYSRYLNDSLLSKINNAAGSGVYILIDHETAMLLQYAEQCYNESDGMFDVTAGILRKIWNFKDIRQPEPEQIDALLPLVGWDKVDWNQNQVYLTQPGMEMDFGGIVKEYAADAAATLCQHSGIDSGIIELGGDVRVLGPLPDGEGWPVAIQDPKKQKPIYKLSIKYGALASSGDYERFIVMNGNRYSHILNPKTGWPVSGMSAVSVQTEHCIVAGSIATIAMLKGKDGPSWLQKQNLPYCCSLASGQFINQLH